MINSVTGMTPAIFANRQTVPNAKAPVAAAEPGGAAALRQDALFTAGVRVSGGGWVNINVFRSERGADDDPIMRVEGTNVDGSPFEVEVNINEVDPRRASVIEMAALDGYFAANGAHRSGVRAAAVSMALSQVSPDAFSRIDFISALKDRMETQRFHGNLPAYAQLRELVDSLLDFAAR